MRVASYSNAFVKLTAWHSKNAMILRNFVQFLEKLIANIQA